MQRHLLVFGLAVSLLVSRGAFAAESCTSQAEMKPEVRDGLAAAASRLALAVQAADDLALRNGSIGELQANFTAVSNLVGATAPQLRGTTPMVEQVYELDGSTLAKTADGTNPDAQFYCTLNKSVAEADFTIPQLPPGLYGFAMVRFEGARPFRVSLLLRQEAGAWKLAGLYPKALTAEGHEGLWFWNQGRAMETAKEPWTAWLYLQEAKSLLTPAAFVSSTHLVKLGDELTAATPPAISGGISAETPLVLKGVDGAEFRVTALSVDSLGPDRLDVSEHIKADSLGDGATARKRNADAAAALLAAHPELRHSFHGVLVSTDVPNTAPFATELAMSEIR